jgi:hypothetical protein
MRRLECWGVWACLGLAMTACAALQTYDLQQAVDHLSQTEVVSRWGLPDGVVAGAEGYTLWIYTARTQVATHAGSLIVTSPGWVVAGGARCTQYLLWFDPGHVLRGWTARPC